MVVGASLGMAWILKKTLLRGPNPLFLMELPTYKWPNLKNIWIGLMERAKLFIYRAGTIILSISIILWFLSSYPKSPSQGIESPIVYSYAGKVGHWLEPLVRPIGFNWKIAVALIPASMAREVIIPSLATVYAVNADQSGNSVEALSQILVKEWSVATGLSLLVWYVFASQCFSTLAVVQRETNSWKWPAFMFTYMTAIAYIGSWITYQVCVRLGF
jgi:ferrous iron transport protein B